MRRGLRRMGPLPLRGESDPIEAYEVIWRWPAAAPMDRGSLAIEHGSIVYRLIDAGTRLTIGRSELCDVVIEHPLASRMHARIEAVGGRYVLHDLSANGTYVRFDDDSEFLLRRAEAPLRRRGRIGLGASTSTDAPVLQFRCD